MLGKKTLSTGEVAKYCDVHFRTVTRWIAQGHLKAYQLPGRGNNRVTLREFLNFLKKHNMPIPGELRLDSKKVLIVDDDLKMARSILRVLKRKGFETAIASDGFQAGIMLGTFSPSILTLDLQMPGSNGFDVIELIRKTPHLSHIKILVVSALGDEQLKKALDCGAQEVLAKPFKNEDLLDKIEKLIDPERLF